MLASQVTHRSGFHAHANPSSWDIEDLQGQLDRFVLICSHGIEYTASLTSRREGIKESAQAEGRL